jgi:hypothetical protein
LSLWGPGTGAQPIGLLPSKQKIQLTKPVLNLHKPDEGGPGALCNQSLLRIQLFGCFIRG